MYRCEKHYIAGKEEHCPKCTAVSESPSVTGLSVEEQNSIDALRYRRTCQALSESKLDYYYLEGRTEDEISEWIDNM